MFKAVIGRFRSRISDQESGHEKLFNEQLKVHVSILPRIRERPDRKLNETLD